MLGLTRALDHVKFFFFFTWCAEAKSKLMHTKGKLALDTQHRLDNLYNTKAGLDLGPSSIKDLRIHADKACDEESSTFNNLLNDLFGRDASLLSAALSL